MLFLSTTEVKKMMKYSRKNNLNQVKNQMKDKFLRNNELNTFDGKMKVQKMHIRQNEMSKKQSQRRIHLSPLNYSKQSFINQSF